MKVLIVDNSSADRMVLGRLLRDLGHEFDQAENGLEALEKYERGGFDLVTTGWMMSGIDGRELVERIRSLRGRPYVYIVMVTRRSSATDRARAFEAGVDDYLSKPCNSGEFISRMAVAERILAHQAAQKSRLEQVENALRRLDVCMTLRQAGAQASGSGSRDGAGAGVAETSTWSNLERNLADSCAGFLRAEVTLAAVPHAMPKDSIASTITMSCPGSQVEIGMGVICERASAERMIETLLGGSALARDEDALGEVACELASACVAQLTGGFLADGFAFTPGLAQRRNLESFQEFLGAYDKQRAIALHSPDARLLAIVGLAERGNVSVPAAFLQAGMVLAKDFLDEHGALLARSGTLLTAKMVGRLSKFGVGVMAEVCHMAELQAPSPAPSAQAA